MTIRTYYTINGEIQSEDSDGVVVDFLTDALGSITATVDQTSTSTANHRYKPYGEQLTTGTAFRMGWVGSLGYRPTGLTGATHYMRARSYGTKQGQWTTVDPMWPWQHQYSYVSARPVNAVDPSGLAELRCRTAERFTTPCAKPNFLWRIQWSLFPDIIGPNLGVVIQRMSVRVGTAPCGDRLSLFPPFVYWEAWNVSGLNFYGNGCQTAFDTWTMEEGKLDGKCQEGNIVMEGEACYFSGVQIQTGIGGWGTIKQAGCLHGHPNSPAG